MYNSRTSRFTGTTGHVSRSRPDTRIKSFNVQSVATGSSQDDNSFVEVKKKRSRQNRSHHDRDRTEQHQEKTIKQNSKENDTIEKYHTFFNNAVNKKCLSPLTITIDATSDVEWDDVFRNTLSSQNVSDEDFAIRVEEVQEEVLPSDICFTNTFLISTKRSSKPESNVCAINDVSYSINTPEEFWSYINRICGSRDADRCTESDKLEQNLINRRVGHSETRKEIGKYNSFQRTTKVSISGSPGTEFTKNSAGDVNNIFTINIRDLDLARLDRHTTSSSQPSTRRCDHFEVCSPDMRSGYLPILLADFVGGGLPSYIRAVSYHPTIVIHRNGNRSEMYPGYRIAIYLVEPSAEIKKDCERFFTDTDPESDCFQRLRSTPYGESYLRDLVEILKPRYS
jgi:hypothetical protein